MENNTVTQDPSHYSDAIAQARAQVAELKKMFTDTAAARSQRQREKPLFDRLGGRDAIHAVVTDVVDLHFSEPVTKPLTKGVDKAKLVRLVVEWLPGRVERALVGAFECCPIIGMDQAQPARKIRRLPLGQPGEHDRVRGPAQALARHREIPAHDRGGLVGEAEPLLGALGRSSCVGHEEREVDNDQPVDGE